MISDSCDSLSNCSKLSSFFRWFLCSLFKFRRESREDHVAEQRHLRTLLSPRNARYNRFSYIRKCVDSALWKCTAYSSFFLSDFLSLILSFSVFLSVFLSVILSLSVMSVILCLIVCVFLSFCLFYLLSFHLLSFSFFSSVSVCLLCRIIFNCDFVSCFKLPPPLPGSRFGDQRVRESAIHQDQLHLGSPEEERPVTRSRLGQGK